jgi:hypothetical protein
VTVDRKKKYYGAGFKLGSFEDNVDPLGHDDADMIESLDSQPRYASPQIPS